MEHEVAHLANLCFYAMTAALTALVGALVALVKARQANGRPRE